MNKKIIIVKGQYKFNPPLSKDQISNLTFNFPSFEFTSKTASLIYLFDAYDDTEFIEMIERMKEYLREERISISGEILGFYDHQQVQITCPRKYCKIKECPFHYEIDYQRSPSNSKYKNITINSIDKEFKKNVENDIEPETVNEEPDIPPTNLEIPKKKKNKRKMTRSNSNPSIDIEHGMLPKVNKNKNQLYLSQFSEGIYGTSDSITDAYLSLLRYQGKKVKNPDDIFIIYGNDFRTMCTMVDKYKEPKDEEKLKSIINKIFTKHLKILPDKPFTDYKKVFFISALNGHVNLIFYKRDKNTIKYFKYNKSLV